MRVFAISDLHVDYPENLRWVEELSFFDYRDDLLILAGDISDLVPLFRKTLKLMTSKFNRVAFIPGNHDLWVRRNRISDSIKKYNIVEKVALDCYVETKVFNAGGVTVLPVHGWYDNSFGDPCSRVRSIWKDYTHCAWPDSYELGDINNYFDSKNIYDLPEPEDNLKISFSHFLPRIDLMPSFIPADKRILYPLLGSKSIEGHVRSIKPSIHVYGHSHVNRSVKKEGVKYVNNAFGYPHEYRITAKCLKKIHEI